MAASAAATMAVSGVVVGSMRTSSELGSSPAFGSRFLLVAPFRPAARRLSVVAKASLPEEQSGRTARREMLAGLMAVSATIVSSGNALASNTTGEKAFDLLKSADSLTNNESPARFGPSQSGDSNSGTVAQKAGGGASEELQGGTTSAIENAKKTVEEAKQNVDKIFGGKKGGSIPDLGLQAPELDDVKGKVKSDVATTEGKVKSDISTTEEGVKSLTGGSGSIIADAQSKVGDVSNELGSKGKKVFDNLQNKSFNLIPQ